MIFSNIVGSFLKWKGIHIYIQAINEIKSNAIFELVGNFGVDNKYNEYIKALLNEKIILKGFIKDIKNYYDTIDVVVHTATEPDSLPTVLIEGLAKGKILIASDVGGVREIVDDGYGNIIVPPNNVEALRDAIIKVSNYSKDKIEKIKQKNIQITKEKFSLSQQIKKMEKIYEETTYGRKN